MLTRDEIYRIHQTALDVLETVGVKFFHEEGLSILKKGGVIVDPKSRVAKFPEYVVMDAVRKVPSRFTLLARNAKKNLRIGVGNTYFTNSYGATHILDSVTGQRRASVMDDLNKATLICDALDNVSFPLIYCHPEDVERSFIECNEFLSIVTNTTKHFELTAWTAEGVRQMVRMAEVIFGREELATNPYYLNVGETPVSPLAYMNDAVGKLIEGARWGMPIDIVTIPMAGGTSPVTMAGTLAQQTAEDLAGIVLCELVHPGLPVFYGSAATSMDLKYGTIANGAPELGILGAASVEIGRFYGLPTFISGGSNDSKVPDQQAAWETMLSDTVGILAHPDIIHNSVYGALEGDLTASFDELILADEMISQIIKVSHSIEVNEDTLAFDVIRKVGPGGNFLIEPHTRKYFSHELWLPQISDRRPRSKWEAAGERKNILFRAKERWTEILKTHQIDPPLDTEKVAELKRLVKGFQSGQVVPPGRVENDG